MDIVYTLDLMSVGLPATLAAKLKGKKVVFRTGGDFLWEKACQSGWTSLPLSQYYESEMSWREKALIWFCRQLLKRADAILFSTDWQKNIYKKYYGVSSLKAKILANALPFIKIEKNPRFKDSVIFAGRLIKVKNLERLIRVFSGIEQVQISLLIFGEGPEKGELKKLIAELGVQEKIKLIDAVDHRTLMSAIAGCRFFILPSLAEISPNLALECSVLAKPIILTRETGLDEVVTQSLILVNPLSEEDIAAKIKYLLDDNNLAAYEANLRQINFSRREWNQVAKEHHEVFKEIMRTA
jgi:glycosyltransferase involved in cell wall biosynthesis